MEKTDFVALGFCSNDYLALLPEIPMDNKVQMLSHLVQGGGPAATASVTAARLGVSSAFIGAVGDDEPGKKILADLESEKVSTSGMVIRRNASSPVAYCWVDAPTGKRSVAWTRGDLQEMSAEEVDLSLVRNAKILHLDGHNPQAALAAAKEAHQHGVIVNLDAGTLRAGVRELLPYVTLFITSELFARQYAQTEDLEKALHILGENGSLVTGVTMGDKGSLVLGENGKIVHCPAFPVAAVYTTGAGDVYHAAFGVRYLETSDVMESMRFASAVAALKCLKMGGRTGIPDRKQLYDFLKSKGDMS